MCPDRVHAGTDTEKNKEQTVTIRKTRIVSAYLIYDGFDIM